MSNANGAATTTTTATTSSSGAPPVVNLLQRIFEHPETLTPLLTQFIEHTRHSYGDAIFTPYLVAMFRHAVARNEPYLNVVIAAMLIDTVDSLRDRVLELDPSDFTRQFLAFMHEKCTHLRSTNFSAANMRETFQQFALLLVDTYLMRNIVVVRHVLRDVDNKRSFDDLGYAPALTAETIANARRREGAAKK